MAQKLQQIFTGNATNFLGPECRFTPCLKCPNNARHGGIQRGGGLRVSRAGERRVAPGERADPPRPSEEGSPGAAGGSAPAAAPSFQRGSFGAPGGTCAPPRPSPAWPHNTDRQHGTLSCLYTNLSLACCDSETIKRTQVTKYRYKLAKFSVCFTQVQRHEIHVNHGL